MSGMFVGNFPSVNYGRFPLQMKNEDLWREINGPPTWLISSKAKQAVFLQTHSSFFLSLCVTCKAVILSEDVAPRPVATCRVRPWIFLAPALVAHSGK